MTVVVGKIRERVVNEVIIQPGTNAEFVREQVLTSDSGSGSSECRGFGAEGDRARELEIRKRKLDLEIEEGRLKLRLVEAERERLNLEAAQIVSQNNVPDFPTATFTNGEQESASTRDDAFLFKMVHVLLEAMKKFQPSGVTANSVSRLVSQKESFSGNSLWWLRFKRAFEQSTNPGGYTNCENVIRLYNRLRGEAHKFVESLMLICESTAEILKILQLRYGSKDTVICKLMNNLKDLPRLQLGDIDLIAFASEVKNNVIALNLLGIIICLIRIS